LISGGPVGSASANLAALDAINADREVPIKIRQSKYLNVRMRVRL